MEISDALKNEIYCIEFWQIFSIILSVTVNTIILLRSKKSQMLFGFMALQATILIWLISKVLKTVSPTVEIRWLFIVTQYFGISFLGWSFYIFSHNLYFQRPIQTNTLFLLAAIPMLMFVMIATNPLHYLFYSQYDFYGDDWGIGFYIFFFIHNLFVIISLILCILGAIRWRKHIRMAQSIVVIVAAIIPALVNAFYISDIVNPVFDITPVVYNVSLMIMGYAVLRYRLFDAVPFVMYEVLGRDYVGFLLLDHKFKLLKCNESGHRLLTQSLDGIDFLALAKRLYQSGVDTQIVEGLNDTWYCLSIIQLADIPFAKASMILIIRNITEHAFQQQVLRQQNEVLAILKLKHAQQRDDVKMQTLKRERQHVARELHDILGHSITLVISLLEAAKIKIESNKKEFYDIVSMAKNLSREGFSKLKGSLMHDEKKMDTDVLKQELTTIIDQSRQTNREIKLQWMSETDQIDSEYYFCILRICQEGISNYIRHSNGKNALIYIKLTGYNIHVAVSDDGKPADEIRPGNGLSGLEARVDMLGGSFSCSGNAKRGVTISADF